MVSMESRAEKDAKTLLIVRALVVCVLVLGAGTLLLVLASRLGLDELHPAVRVLTAAAALGTVVLVLRRRD